METGGQQRRRGWRQPRQSTPVEGQRPRPRIKRLMPDPPQASLGATETAPARRHTQVNSFQSSPEVGSKSNFGSYSSTRMMPSPKSYCVSQRSQRSVPFPQASTSSVQSPASRPQVVSKEVGAKVSSESKLHPLASWMSASRFRSRVQVNSSESTTHAGSSRSTTHAGSSESTTHAGTSRSATHAGTRSTNNVDSSWPTSEACSSGSASLVGYSGSTIDACSSGSTSTSQTDSFPSTSQAGFDQSVFGYKSGARTITESTFASELDKRFRLPSQSVCSTKSVFWVQSGIGTVSPSQASTILSQASGQQAVGREVEAVSVIKVSRKGESRRGVKREREDDDLEECDRPRVKRFRRETLLELAIGWLLRIKDRFGKDGKQQCKPVSGARG